MKYILLTARLLQGFIFFLFGLNNILHFIHLPEPTGDALLWMQIMNSHGYFTFVGVLMVIAGLLLLVGRFVPLALTLLAPIVVNIMLYHTLLWPHGIAPGILATLLEVILLIAYHRSFFSLFQPNPEAAPKL